MRGSHFGKLFSFVSFGESHGHALGVVLDGVPANLSFCGQDLQSHLSRRAPGHFPWTTSRKEPDKAIVLSGIYQGKTLGSPIAVMVENKAQRSQDYQGWEKIYRAGHADQTSELKYGTRDPRGGGRASGRETLARVIAGYFAGLILPETSIATKILRVGEKQLPDTVPETFGQHYGEYLMDCKERGDSVGHELQLEVRGVPIGLGEPAFDKVKADLAKALLSIGGCVGMSWGEQDLSQLTGQSLGQSSYLFAGLEGGITNGDRLVFRVSFKAPSTVGEKAKRGRHDPCLAPRAIVVAESMALCVLADHYLRQKAYQ